MAGLVPAIHVFLDAAVKTWMPGTGPGHDDENIPVMAMLLTAPHPHPALIPPSTV